MRASFADDIPTSSGLATGNSALQETGAILEIANATTGDTSSISLKDNAAFGFQSSISEKELYPNESFATIKSKYEDSLGLDAGWFALTGYADNPNSLWMRAIPPARSARGSTA